MTAEAAGIGPALRRSLSDISRGSEDFALRRVTRSLALVGGIGCAILGTQGLANAIAMTQELPGWHRPLLVAVFAPLTLMVAGCATGILARTASAIFAVVVPLVLLVWPIATAGVPASPDEQPWIWYLLNVATTAAVLAFPMAAQIGWAMAIPLLYTAVRAAQLADVPGETVFVVLDGVFAAIFAGVVITLAWMLRAVAARIDAARANTVASYADAAAADAAERERIAIAGLMHDSVLAALIAAERADTDRARTLAVAMARDALTRLANADRDSEEGSDAPVTPDALGDQLAAVARDGGVDLTVERRIVRDAAPIPGRIARALALAATQALGNAVEHAGGAGLAIVVAADARRVEIRVCDTGGGFDPDAVPVDRLGIRASIRARMAAVAGSARITSGRGGTTVTLTWDHER